MSNQGQHTAPKMTEKEMMAFLQSSIMKDPTLAQKMYNNMMSEGGASLQHVPTLDISNGGNVTGIRVDISKEAVQPKEHVPLVDNSDNKYKGDYVTIEKELGEGMLFYKTIVNQVCPSSKLEDALCACPNCTICLTNLQKEVDNGNDCIVLDRADRCPDWCKYCDDGVFVPKLNVDVGNNGSLPDNTHNNTHDNVKASPPKIDQNTMSASDRLAKVFANVSSAKAKNITTCTTQIPITVQSVPKAAPQYAKQSGQRASFAKPPVRAPSVVGDDTIPKSKPDQREKGVDIDTKLSSIGASISGVINRLAGVERSQVEMNKIIHHGFRSNLDLSRAFYSIPIATEDRIYLGTVIHGTFYMYGSLPMGMGVSPAVLQERIQEILPEKSGNCDIYTYVDDVGIHGVKKEHDRCVKATAQGLQVGGFKVNLAKSNTTGKFCKFANFSITDSGISIQDAVLQDMQVLLELLVTKGTNTKAEYASVKGKLTWNALMLPPLATNVIDSLQHHLNNRDSWSTSIPIRKDTRLLIHHLLVKLANYTQFKASLPTSKNVLLVVDSSSTHWGGFFFPGGGKPILQLRGAHGKNVPAAANVKELEAVLRGLQHIKDMIEPGTAFQVMYDRIHVVHSLREVTEKKSWKAAYVTRWKEIRELERAYDLRINYLFCPGEANSADGLSRPELAQQDAETKARIDWQKRNVKDNNYYIC
eukprot:GHVR01006593.1.p1 GENE.GHVR01006593.1~~GHVR01006593.1.p1  ORF type:complete len:701 (+),score=68.21 GHVR01006593.1:142-2244(+)